MGLEAYQPYDRFTTEKALTHIPEIYKIDPKTYNEKELTINIGSKESTKEARLLSNFASTPFTLDGATYASMEAFIQSLKFLDPEEQAEVAKMSGPEAKRAGKHMASYIKQSYDTSDEKEEPVGFVATYQGIQIPFRSPEYYGLIERAMRAKFEQNRDAYWALVGEKHNRRGKIIHILTRDDGSAIQESPTTALPAEVFCSILMRIRYEEQIAYWEDTADKQGENIDYLLRQFLYSDVESRNPDVERIRRVGYRSEAVKSLTSATKEGMKYGTSSQRERIEKAKEFAEMAGYESWDAFLEDTHFRVRKKPK